MAPVVRSILFVFEDADYAPAPMQLIVQLYGLTPAECRLAVALLAGLSLAHYAEEHRLTLNTVKTQLRALFALGNIHPDWSNGRCRYQMT